MMMDIAILGKAAQKCLNVIISWMIIIVKDPSFSFMSYIIYGIVALLNTKYNLPQSLVMHGVLPRAIVVFTGDVPESLNHCITEHAESYAVCYLGLSCSKG